MNTLIILLQIFLYYTLQIVICCFINTLTNVNFPKTAWEFIKLTFLPYVIWRLIFKKKIEPNQDEKTLIFQQLNKINPKIIEQYLRQKKLHKIK